MFSVLYKLLLILNENVIYEIGNATYERSAALKS